VALKLTLKPDERVIIGGAVVRNAGGHTSLSVENEIPVLRGKRVISPDSVATPAQRLAFTIQLMYLSGGRTEELEQVYITLMTDIGREAPSTGPRLRVISDAVITGNYYLALKQSWELIVYERELIKNAKCL
jgi:flagellar biosynthesis repressor protein FlbT